MSTAQTPRPDGTEARETLGRLSADRDALDRSTRTPGWLAPVMALLTAGWVASPALSSGDDGRATAYIGALVVGVAFFLLARRATGRKGSGPARREWPLVVLLLIVTLLMYSVSLGLVSLGHDLWVVLPALVALVSVFLGMRALDRGARERLHS